ncbi:hypothetical protein D3C72_1608080 [compost metagenome]
MLLQRVGDFNAGQHADDAVKAAPGHDRVAMRAGGDGFARGVAAGAGADQVAARIQPSRQARGFEFAAQPGARVIEQRRKGAARPGDVGQGELGQGFNAGPQAVGVEWRECGGGGSRMRHEEIPEDAPGIMSCVQVASCPEVTYSARCGLSKAAWQLRLKNPAARTVRAFPEKPPRLRALPRCCDMRRCVRRCRRSRRR